MASRAYTVVLVLGIAACSGTQRTEARHQDFDLRTLLPHGVETPTDASTQEHHAALRVGPDSLEVTIRWRTFAQGASRYLASASVDIPAHDASTTYKASVSQTPFNMGTSDAVLEAIPLQISWQRQSRTRSELGTESGTIMADGNWRQN